MGLDHFISLQLSIGNNLKQENGSEIFSHQLFDCECETDDEHERIDRDSYYQNGCEHVLTTFQ